MEDFNLYEALGIGKSASQDDIRIAYRRKVKDCHPDKGGKPDDFMKVLTAYTVLSETETRDKYDASGHYELHKEDMYGKITAYFAGLLMEQVEGNIHNSDNLNKDYVKIIDNECASRISEYDGKMAMIEKELKFVKKFKKKLKFKGNTIDVASEILNSKIKELDDILNRIKYEVDLINGVRALLKLYEFDVLLALAE